jgi:hypothetical protein
MDEGMNALRRETIENRALNYLSEALGEIVEVDRDKLNGTVSCYQDPYSCSLVIEFRILNPYIIKGYRDE